MVAAVLRPLAASSQLPAWVCMSHHEPELCSGFTSDFMCEVPATLNGQDSYGLTPATREYMLCICSWAAAVVVGSTLPKKVAVAVDGVAGLSCAAVPLEVEKG